MNLDRDPNDLISREEALAALRKQPLADTILADPSQRVITVKEACDTLASLPAIPLDRELLEELEMAWIIIANSYDGDWDSLAPAEWRSAAERWRDRYLEILRGALPVLETKTEPE